MIDFFKLENNVTTKIVNGLSENSTIIIIEKTSEPYNDPIAPNENEIGVMTLIDNHLKPEKIEIVYFKNITDNGDGTLTLTGVERGKEDTPKQSFVSGSTATQSLTREAIDRFIAGINKNYSVSMELSGNVLDMPAYGISLTDISNWNDAFSWGNHSEYGYLTDIKSEAIGDLLDVDLTNISNNKILKWNETSKKFEISADENTTYVSSDFNHDGLTNYKENEHIDWTKDQNDSDYIHKNNINLIDGGTF